MLSAVPGGPPQRRRPAARQVLNLGLDLRKHVASEDTGRPAADGLRLPTARPGMLGRLIRPSPDRGGPGRPHARMRMRRDGPITPG
jgi:hypothetical protein